MLTLRCTFCGERSETEFRCGGQAHVERPAAWEQITDPEWGDYLFTESNPRGVLLERWCHSFGCGEWFNVARHTASHLILLTYPMGAPPPDLGTER